MEISFILWVIFIGLALATFATLVYEMVYAIEHETSNPKAVFILFASTIGVGILCLSAIVFNI